MNYRNLQTVAFIGIFLIVFVSDSFSQDEDKLKIGWNNRRVGTLNFTQTTFDNWSAGGENSWSWLANLNGSFIDKQEKYQ